MCFLSQVAKLPFLINDGKWHHLCITWTTRDGMWEAFQDGVMRGSGENLAPYHPIKPEGVLVLGQEQVRRQLTTHCGVSKQLRTCFSKIYLLSQNLYYWIRMFFNTI